MKFLVLLPVLLASAQAFELVHPKEYNSYETKPYSGYEHNYGYGHPHNHEGHGYPSYYGSFDLSHGYNGFLGYAPHLSTSYAPHGYAPNSYLPSSYAPNSYAVHPYGPATYGAPHLYAPHGYGAHFYKPLNKYQKYGLPYY
ncbi:unnamed protein product [Auanema sp. JU1783]|nr:unnamed protein product [Auanema sp. JU1783]